MAQRPLRGFSSHFGAEACGSWGICLGYYATAEAQAMLCLFPSTLQVLLDVPECLSCRSSGRSVRVIGQELNHIRTENVLFQIVELRAGLSGPLYSRGHECLLSAENSLSSSN